MAGDHLPYYIDQEHETHAGLINSVNFTEIRWIRSSPNFKIGGFTVYGFKIFEKIKNM
jgi:hypothetical protein